MAGVERREPIERSIFQHTFYFPERTVQALVFACPHSTAEDTRFLHSHLQIVSNISNRTLFIEQGTGRQSDHITKQLQHLAAANPVIAQDFFRRIAEGIPSVAETAYMAGTPFAEAADFWKEKGGKLVNMDLGANLSPAVITFLFQNTTPELVIEHIFSEVRGACYSWEDTIPLIVKSLLPNLSPDYIDQQCKRLYPLYFNARKYLDHLTETRQEQNKLREAFMRQTLEQHLQSNDVVLAHPNHIKSIL